MISHETSILECVHPNSEQPKNCSAKISTVTPTFGCWITISKMNPSTSIHRLGAVMAVISKLLGGWPTPLKNMTSDQLGWWNSQLNGKIKAVFQTTNQQMIELIMMIILPTVVLKYDSRYQHCLAELQQWHHVLRSYIITCPCHFRAC